MTFAERLILAMRVTGITNSELAAKTGMEQSTISHFTGGGREPSLANLGKLLRALPNIDARWLVIGDE